MRPRWLAGAAFVILGLLAIRYWLGASGLGFFVGFVFCSPYTFNRKFDLATTDSIVSKLPANVEAERSILGAILLDNMAITRRRRTYERMIFRSTRTGGFTRE